MLLKKLYQKQQQPAYFAYNTHFALSMLRLIGNRQGHIIIQNEIKDRGQGTLRIPIAISQSVQLLIFLLTKIFKK